MRPIYENQQTRETERAILKYFLKGSRNTPVKLPMRYRLDWMILNEKRHLAAWVECKRRHHQRGKYDTFMLSMAKWNEGVFLHEKGGKPVYIVVEWDDGIFYVRQDEILDQVHFGIGGRTDRNDPEDIEPCVFIPVHLFKLRAVRDCESTPTPGVNASSMS